MSPRPKKASDEEVFAAVYRAMARLGPRELTLAEIAAEAGVTAGALVQRFGSRRALLLAMTARWADSAPDLFGALRAQHASPLGVLRAYGQCIAGLASSPSAYARNLAYLMIDLTDDDFRKHLLRHARATRAELVAVIRAAIEAGELGMTTNADRLARSVEMTINGSLMTWALHRRGRSAVWLAEDLEATLAPWVLER